MKKICFCSLLIYGVITVAIFITDDLIVNENILIDTFSNKFYHLKILTSFYSAPAIR